MILDLVNQDKSDVLYTKQSFPDGQQNIVIKDGQYIITDVEIKSRLNNFKDLELIVAANQSLIRYGVEKRNLHVPYIVGARSDRKFEVGGNNYLKDVISPIINSQDFSNIWCLDPHSYALENTINNLAPLNIAHFYEWCREQIKGDLVFVSPDAGAQKRANLAMDVIQPSASILTAAKKRGVDGKISNTEVPLEAYHYRNKKVILVDDICDGGATFTNIASQIKKIYNVEIYLIVTHGIFSKGYEKLSECIDYVLTTNSYQDVNIEKVAFESKGKLSLKQYNIYE